MINHPTGWGYAYGHKSLSHQFALWRLSKWLGYVARVVGVSLGLVLAVQLVYPRQLSRPWLQVQGVAVGAQNAQTVGRRLAVLEQKSVRLQAARQTYQPKFSDVGIYVDQATSARVTLSYSWRERLVPFSLFRRRLDLKLSKRFDDTRIKNWASLVASQNSQSPVNATVQKQATDYKIMPANAGVTYDTATVAQQLKLVPVAPGTTVSITGKTLPPAVSTAMVEEVVQTWQKQTSQPLQVTVAGAPLNIAPSELQKITTVVTDPATARVAIQYDRAALKTHLAAAANQAGTSLSASAQAVSLDDGVNQMITGLAKGQSVSIELKPVVITTPTPRGYSPTSGGALALIMDWQRDTGLNTGVFFKELGSPYRTAGYRATDQFTTASTYKAFVGYYVYNRIDQGTLTYDDSQGLDRSVRSCMVEMLVWSTNICSVAFGRRFGWETILEQSRQIGVKNTHLESGNMLSTPTDLALLLEKLNNGSLLQPSTTDAFLGALKRHPYRDGIPAGVPGIMVADKVGWIAGVENDAALVYHPRGTYILVVMTHGGTTRQIADLSRRINQFVSQ